jgi:hypothetical protein
MNVSAGSARRKRHHKDAVCISLDQELASELCEGSELDDPIRFCALGCETDQDCIALDKDLSCIGGFCGAIGEMGAMSGSALSDPARLGQQGDPCSTSADCEAPLVCGYSKTCELHQVVSHANGQIFALAANDQYIYWFESGFGSLTTNYSVNGKLNGSIARAPIEGGPREEVIVDELAQPIVLMVDDTHLYYGRIHESILFTLWRTPHSNTISESEASGTRIYEYLSGEDRIIMGFDRIVQDLTHVFIVHADGRVIAIDKSSGESEQVAQLWSRVAVVPGVAVDQDCLYVCTSHFDSENSAYPYDLDVRCYDKQNWQETVIADLGSAPGGSYCQLDMTDDYLVVLAPALPSVTLIDKESGETRPLAHLTIPPTMPLADMSEAYLYIAIQAFNSTILAPSGPWQVYDEYIYWISEFPEDPLRLFVNRAPLETGQTETMLKLPTNITEDFSDTLTTISDPRLLLLLSTFLVTNDAIYWADPENDNAIMRLDLP